MNAQLKTILISGGSGMLGTALTEHLVNEGYRVIILTRNPQIAKGENWKGSAVSFAHWDVEAQEMDWKALGEADAIVHLAGAGVVAKPWTKKYKQEIINSRVNSSKLLIRGIREHGSKLTSVISASAIGWYGPDRPGINHPFQEEDPHASGFLGETCYQWEESIKPVLELGKRLVIGRIGIVLSNSGGALAGIKKPLKFRVAGVLGNGKQVMSWIHVKDLCNAFRFALENASMEGTYNLVAPNPVTNRFLTQCLAREMYGNAFVELPVPALALKAMLGERTIAVINSATVSASKLLNAGFKFNFPVIEEAMHDIIRK